MRARHVSFEFAVLAMLCAAVLFFFVFPTAHGPYSVVNGPATTLVSIRARLLLWLGMTPILIRSLNRHRGQGLTARSLARNEILLRLAVPPERTSVLRC